MRKVKTHFPAQPQTQRFRGECRTSTARELEEKAEAESRFIQSQSELLPAHQRSCSQMGSSSDSVLPAEATVESPICFNEDFEDYKKNCIPPKQPKKTSGNEALKPDGGV